MGVKIARAAQPEAGSGSSSESRVRFHGETDDSYRLIAIHAGFNSGQANNQALAIRHAMIERGVPPERIIVLPGNYPAFAPKPSASTRFSGAAQQAESSLLSHGQRKLNEAWGWCSNFCRNVRLYWNYSKPESDEAGRVYRQLHQSLPQIQGKRLRVTYIGYSGGGQAGLTTAGLARNDQHFDLDHVITLGSPVMANPAPAQVRISSYVSDGDTVLNGTDYLPYVQAVPPNMDANDRTVRFGPRVDHGAWLRDRAVLDSVFAEIADVIPLEEKKLVSDQADPMPEDAPAAPQPDPLPSPQTEVSFLPGEMKLALKA